MEQQDMTQETAYEAPELVEVGAFAELTLGGPGWQPEFYWFFGLG